MRRQEGGHEGLPHLLRRKQPGWGSDLHACLGCQGTRRIAVFSQDLAREDMAEGVSSDWLICLGSRNILRELGQGNYGEPRGPLHLLMPGICFVL